METPYFYRIKTQDMQVRPQTKEEYLKQINMIVEYICNHLSERIDTGMLAEMSGFSPWHFHRTTKAFLGEPLGAFMIRKRMERAARLLRYTELPIQEIAYETGYEVPSSLSKVFRQYYGISPNAYRNHKNFIIMKPEQINPHLKINGPQIKTLSSRQAIYIRLHGTYSNNDYCGTWNKLWKFVQEQNLFCPDMEYICIYHDDPKVTEPEKLHTDVCLTLNATASPKGEIGLKTIEGGKYAIFSYQGPYSDLGAVYDMIYSQYLPSNGYRIGMSQGYEKYLNNPSDTAPENLLTEIYIPVE